MSIPAQYTKCHSEQSLVHFTIMFSCQIAIQAYTRIDYMHEQDNYGTNYGTDMLKSDTQDIASYSDYKDISFVMIPEIFSE